MVVVMVVTTVVMMIAIMAVMMVYNDRFSDVCDPIDGYSHD